MSTASIDTRGFTYLVSLMIMLVMGIALTTVSKHWRTVVMREKEQELLFRGDQIRKAIESYYNSSPSGSPKYPGSPAELIKDNRFLAVRRHLRKLYKDPMTAEGEWILLRDGKGGIKGVQSRSKDKPIKTGNFPEGYEGFEGAVDYSSWKFVYNPPVGGQGSNPALMGTGQGGGSSSGPPSGRRP